MTESKRRATKVERSDLDTRNSQASTDAEKRIEETIEANAVSRQENDPVILPSHSGEDATVQPDGVGGDRRVSGGAWTTEPRELDDKTAEVSGVTTGHGKPDGQIVKAGEKPNFEGSEENNEFVLSKAVYEERWVSGAKEPFYYQLYPEGARLPLSVARNND